jgi:hypothetical protein
VRVSHATKKRGNKSFLLATESKRRIAMQY